MEKRKKPEKDLRNKSGLFFQIGVFAALLLVVSAFEYKQKDSNIVVCSLPTEAEPQWIVPPTDIPPPPPPPKPVVHNPVEADPEEPEIEIPDIIIDTEIIPDPPEEFVEPKEEPVSELPFDIVESMPEPEGGFEAFYKYVSK